MENSSDQLTCLLRNLYAAQEATVRTGHGTTDWFQIGKGVPQGCILSRAYLTYMQSTSCKMMGWMKHKLESRLPGEISITSGYADDTTLMVESKEELRRLFMKMKEECEKSGLKPNIQKTKLTASSPITSWQIIGKKVEIVKSFIYLDSKINVDGDCSHKIKRQLLLGRKTNDKPRQHIKKQSTLPIQHFVCIVKAIVFPVVMYGCESWTIETAEC